MPCFKPVPSSPPYPSLLPRDPVQNKWNLCLAQIKKLWGGVREHLCEIFSAIVVGGIASYGVAQIDHNNKLWPGIIAGFVGGCIGSFIPQLLMCCRDKYFEIIE